MPKDFSHLHVHSIYSLLDGSNKIDKLCERVKELGMTSIAITDHGVMSGCVEFYKQCKKNSVKPILGIEAYITDDEDGVPKENRHRDNNHLVMVAMNNEGYENLLFMSSNAALNNFYYKPRISKTTLAKHSKGIIATSACLGNECNRKACWIPEDKRYEDPNKDVRKAAAWYKEVFQGRYYLEIQDNDDKAGQQAAYNSFIMGIGKELDIPMVITSDAHYLHKEDKDTHDMLMAMQLKQTLTQYKDPSNTFQYGPWFYIRSGDEMYEAAKKYNCSQAFENTLVIASQCNLELELGKYKPPTFPIDQVEDRKEFEEWLKHRHEED